MWWDQMFNWPSWVAVSLMTTIAVGGLAWLIVLALREEFRPRVIDPRGRLDVRLARGEIDPTEYRKRVSALTEVRDA
jgi:hypothetical protein